MFRQTLKSRTLEIRQAVGQMPTLPRVCFFATPIFLLIQLTIVIALWPFPWMWFILYPALAIDWVISMIGWVSAKRWAKRNPDKLLNLQWAAYPLVALVIVFAIIRPFLLSFGGIILLILFGFPVAAVARMLTLLVIMSGTKPKVFSMLRRAIKARKKQDPWAGKKGDPG